MRGDYVDAGTTSLSLSPIPGPVGIGTWTPHHGSPERSLSGNLSLRDHLSDVDVDEWIAEIGCHNAPIPRNNVKTALRFFDTQMPDLDIGEAVSFLAAMDLSKPVKRVLLQPGERLIAFRTAEESPFKLFFARRGQSPHSSGINTAGRTAVHFVVETPVAALESFTTGAIDTWTPHASDQATSIAPKAQRWFGRKFGVVAMGGAGQLIIPNSARHLAVEG